MKPNLLFTDTARLLASATVLLLTACGTPSGPASDKPIPKDTPSEGTIYISVDESFKPVIDSQIKVYEASYPKAHIVAEYKSEAECLKDLESDSTRMVIVTRGLTDAETNGFQQKLGFRPSWGVLAYDAIAVVVNKQGKDSIFTRAEIADILAGTSGKNLKVVMDGLKATSTVRYAIDSLLKGRKLGANVVAAPNSREVIDFVSKDPNAIGMIGVSWIGNSDDPEQLSFLTKVNVASLGCENCGETVTYLKPFQANIALGRYPMLRSLNYIVKENFNGLGKGFVNFMIYERGQLIFKHAYLLPGRMNFEIRDMQIKE